MSAFYEHHKDSIRFGYRYLQLIAAVLNKSCNDPT